METLKPVPTHWLKSKYYDDNNTVNTTIHTVYKDNKFIEGEAIRILKSTKDENLYYYEACLKGKFGS